MTIRESDGFGGMLHQNKDSKYLKSQPKYILTFIIKYERVLYNCNIKDAKGRDKYSRIELIF